jgi:hypothetical protein
MTVRSDLCSGGENATTIHAVEPPVSERTACTACWAAVTDGRSLIRLSQSPMFLRPGGFSHGIASFIANMKENSRMSAIVRRLVLAKGAIRRVIEALHSLRERYRQPIRIDALAAQAGMSPASF